MLFCTSTLTHKMHPYSPSIYYWSYPYPYSFCSTHCCSWRRRSVWVFPSLDETSIPSIYYWSYPYPCPPHSTHRCFWCQHSVWAPPSRRPCWLPPAPPTAACPPRVACLTTSGPETRLHETWRRVKATCITGGMETIHQATCISGGIESLTSISKKILHFTWMLTVKQLQHLCLTSSHYWVQSHKIISSK